MCSRSKIVGMAALKPIAVDKIFALVRRAFPFRDLTQEGFDRILNYLEGGGASLAKRYSNLFGKIQLEKGVVSLAHPRVGRDLLVNIGTIVSEGAIDVLLKRRCLGAVEENFINPNAAQQCNLMPAMGIIQVADDFSKRGIGGITALNNKDFASTAFCSPVRG